MLKKLTPSFPPHLICLMKEYMSEITFSGKYNHNFFKLSLIQNYENILSFRAHCFVNFTCVLVIVCVCVSVCVLVIGWGVITC